MLVLRHIFSSCAFAACPTKSAQRRLTDEQADQNCQDDVPKFLNLYPLRLMQLCYCIALHHTMPESTLVSYEHIPNHLVGPTSGHFVFPQENIFVAMLANFKLISFLPLTNKDALNDQFIILLVPTSWTLNFKIRFLKH